MKKTLGLGLLALLLLPTTGCYVYQTPPPPSRTVVVDQPASRQEVVTVLPHGYRTRVYRGSTYYYYGHRYYRPHPRGGYVVVTRPW